MNNPQSRNQDFCLEGLFFRRAQKTFKETREKYETNILSLTISGNISGRRFYYQNRVILKPKMSKVYSILRRTYRAYTAHSHPQLHLTVAENLEGARYIKK